MTRDKTYPRRRYRGRGQEILRRIAGMIVGRVGPAVVDPGRHAQQVLDRHPFHAGRGSVRELRQVRQNRVV